MNPGDESAAGLETGITLEIFREGLRVAERYFVLALIMSAISVAALQAGIVSITLQNTDIKVSGNLVSIAAVAISWCSAWLCISNVRNVRKFVANNGGNAVHLPPKAAQLAVSAPSIVTTSPGLIRIMIAVVMGILVLFPTASNYFELPASTRQYFSSSRLLWLLLFILELPYILLIFYSRVYVPNTNEKSSSPV
jgi:hypothetical protein